MFPPWGMYPTFAIAVSPTTFRVCCALSHVPSTECVYCAVPSLGWLRRQAHRPDPSLESCVQNLEFRSRALAGRRRETEPPGRLRGRLEHCQPRVGGQPSVGHGRGMPEAMSCMRVLVCIVVACPAMMLCLVDRAWGAVMHSEFRLFR